MLARLTEFAQRHSTDLTAWRRHLHANPEISFQEFETTKWLARHLDEWGLPFVRPTATGLVGLIEGTQPGPTIAVRADIDALPIDEENTFSFRSTRPGAMHACGHDGHTAILLGLSQFLAGNRDFPGRVKLLFQHAEERHPGGALQFVDAGMLDDVQACIGLHLISDIPTGRAGITEGPMLANSDSFDAVIQGKGGHGSAPHQTVDAVMVACHAVVNLQTIISRKVDPQRPAVISVGSVHGGTINNVIAERAELKGTVRSFHADVRQHLHEEIKRTLQATCEMYGASVTLHYQFGYPVCNNDPSITHVLRNAAAEVLGPSEVLRQEPLLGSEDFAYYSQKVPSAFLFLGCGNPHAGSDRPHHHPRFTIDEAALPLGVEILGRAALSLLTRQS